MQARVSHMANSSIFKNRKVAVRQLNHHQEFAILNDFCVQNSDFFDFQSGINGHLQAAEEILTDLPPGKQLTDKSIWGAFEQDRLLAIIEGTADYPEKGIWYLGLFIIDDSLKKTGFSSEYYHHFETILLPDSADTIRIAVLSGNQTALKFWLKKGYVEIKRKEKTFGNKTHLLIVMEKEL